jgi:hypothetical protein
LRVVGLNHLRNLDCSCIFHTHLEII